MASEKVKTFTDNNFDDEKKSGVVLVDFWAEWCGPCRRLAPTVDALATEFDGRATVAKLNVDENPTIPERYAVRGIPTLLLFKEGELTETIVGLRGKEDIANKLPQQIRTTNGVSRGSQGRHHRIGAGGSHCRSLHSARQSRAIAGRGARSRGAAHADDHGRKLAGVP